MTPCRTLGFATWDGVSEPVHRLLCCRVQALSLVVTVEDTAGAALYVNGGGIAVLDEWTGFVVAPRSAAQLFGERAKLGTAVDVALGPLARTAVRARN